MKYSIDLQAPFGFPLYWYAIGLGLILLSLLLRYLMTRSSGIRSPMRLDKLRRQTLSNIDEISRAYKNGELDTRGVHQKMSLQLRQFVQAATGWRTESMTPDEMAALAKPELGSLIKEYTEPEFSYRPEADSKAAIENGQKLVESMYDYALQLQKGAFQAMLRRGGSRVLHALYLIAPGGLRAKVYRRIRDRSFNKIEALELAFREKALDPPALHLQVSREIRNFILAAAGWSSTDPVCDKLRRMGRRDLAELAGPFYEPEFTRHDEQGAYLSINQGKELIKKWM